MTQSKYDSCVYYYYKNRKVIIVAVFLDDLVTFSNIADFIKTLKDGLSRSFALNVTRDRQKWTIVLSQTDYVDSILRTFNMQDCRGISIPMEISPSLNTSMSPAKPADETRLQSIPYQSAVGSLLYLVQTTRPDIAFAVSTVSRYNNCFDNRHWTAIKSSISGYIFTMQGGAISWNSKVQHTIALSSTEAEYLSLSLSLLPYKRLCG